MYRKVVVVMLAFSLVLTACSSKNEVNDSQTKNKENAVSGSAMEKPEGTPPVGMEKPEGLQQSADGNQPGGGPGGAQAAPSSYKSVKEYSSNKSTLSGKIKSTGTDQNAIHVFGNAELSLKNATIERESEDSTGGDQASFYGTGAAVLVTEGNADIKGGSIKTDAKGGAGVFSYGTGNVSIVNTKIETKQAASGGIHVAGGGSCVATNLKVATYGESSAAIRSDRGGGKMTIKKGTYTSNGTGSPAIYCTANISVNQATLTANHSEAVCIEGMNQLSLKNCKLTGNMPDNSQNDCKWNVILYQSMSGDAKEGNSSFSMDGGTLTAKSGGMFYTTNTESTFFLKNVDIHYSKTNDFFLKCTGNSNKRGWGTTGKNGADCKFTTQKQSMKGNVIWDRISTLDFSMKNGSLLKGAFLCEKDSSGDGVANLNLDESSKWIVTKNSVLTNLSNKGTIVDTCGKSVTIKNTKGKVLKKGTGSITITVTQYNK